MAVELSTQYIKDHNSFPRHAHLHVICKFHRSIKTLRALHRRLAPPTLIAVPPACHITENFEATRAHFQQHRWAFAEQIVDAQFHARLVHTWPPRRYLDPPTSMEKSYDIGFRWERGRADPKFLDAFPCLRAFLDYLRSDRFADRVSRYHGKPMTCYSFLLTTSYPGSSVVPHKDSVFQSDEVAEMMNFAFFLNGTGGPRSGGLAVMRDNEFRDVIFEPTHLCNTLLVYDSKAPLFHGFRPIRFGKFRWAIFAQFMGTHATRA